MVLLLFVFLTVCASTQYGAVSCNDGACKIVRSLQPFRARAGFQAVGSFDDTLNTTGWGVLSISAGSGTNEQKMFAAGIFFFFFFFFFLELSPSQALLNAI
jgi:hypothetical protein